MGSVARMKHSARQRYRNVCRTVSIAAAALFVIPVLCSASGAIAVCGDATGDGVIASSDALLTLRTAVGAAVCVPPRCDTNQSGTITAGDAHTILRSAVGEAVDLDCPPEEVPASTTTSTVTTSTVPAVCGNDLVEDGEDCEPSESFCRGGCNEWTGVCVDFMCMANCRCPKPACGDWLVDPGEECDPPGSACDGGTCSDSCGCAP